MNRPFGKPWPDTFFARKTTDKVPNTDLSEKTIVFTGGTDGMGRIAVERFVEMGAHVCLLGRNPEKTQGVVEALAAKGYDGRVFTVQCDLGSLEAVRTAAQTILSRYEQVHYLINCAGINVSERKLSVDGYEMNFAVNYLGPFLLTELLLERLSSTPSARILQLTSATQAVADLRFDDLQLKTKWSMLASYAQAKLCLNMHARDVAKRLEDNDVSINYLNPGYIRTNLTRYAKGPERLFMNLFGNLAAPTWVGGERIVAAALDDRYRAHSGAYIYEDIIVDPNPLALDDKNVSRLMDISRSLVRLADSDNGDQRNTA